MKLDRASSAAGSAGTVRSRTTCTVGLVARARSRLASPATAGGTWAARTARARGRPAGIGASPAFSPPTGRRWTFAGRSPGRAGGSHPWLLGMNTRRQGRHDGACWGSGSTRSTMAGAGACWSAGALAACSRVSWRRRSRQGPRGGDSGLALFGRPQDQHQCPRIYERIAGHDVDEPPFPQCADKPPVPTLALWSRQDGIVAPRAARGLDHEVDKAVEIDTYHMGFAVDRPALSRIVDRRSAHS